MSSSEELDISSALQSTPVAKSRKRGQEEDAPQIFGKVGTPMVEIADSAEWDEFKKREMAKRKWKRYLRSKWNLDKSELPLESDSSHLLGRHEHYAAIQRAQEHVVDGLDALNEMNFNVGRGEAINIQLNGRDVPKKKCKKFAAAVEKALAEMGNPTMEEMMEDDLDEEEARREAQFAAKFKKRSARARQRADDIKEFEVGHHFSPWEEYCVVMEDKGKEDKIDEKHFKKWLEKKIEENKVSYNYNAYQQEMLALDKDGLKERPTSLKSVVKGVRDFYRNLRNNKKK